MVIRQPKYSCTYISQSSIFTGLFTHYHCACATAIGDQNKQTIYTIDYNESDLDIYGIYLNKVHVGTAAFPLEYILIHAKQVNVSP